MGYDAVGVNALDLAAGLDFLRELAADQPPVWLSADLMIPDEDRPPFPPGYVFSRGELDIGVIALTGALPPGAVGDGEPELELRPWPEVLPEQIQYFGAQSDILILLSGLDREDNEAIADEFAEIHLILRAGRDTDANLRPRRVNNTVLTAVGRQGKRLGIMDIAWTPDQIWFDQDLEQLAEKRQELDRQNWHWRSLQRSRQAGEGQRHQTEDRESDKVYRQRMAEYEEELRQEIRALEKAVAKLEKTAGQRRVGSFDNHFIALDNDYPEDEEMLRLVEATNREINEIGRRQARGQSEAAERAPATGQESSPYLGWEACAQCHRQQADNWRQTRHARAYETLEEKQRQYDPACISCHVTGTYEDETRAMALPSGLRGVGCEVCHGPGRDHVQARQGNQTSDGDTANITRTPRDRTCQRCHTPEQSPDFNFSDAMGYYEDLCRPPG